MGICNSSKDNSTKEKKNSIVKKVEKQVTKQLNYFILPEGLAKRDDIKKYYKLNNEIIGEGGSGKVCIGINDKGKFAIKRILKAKVQYEKELKLEAELSLNLRHKNIMNFNEIYEDNEYISFVMDLGEGGDLFDFIVECPNGHLPVDISIELLIQIFDVINFLHVEKNIMHRDIKPENFIIQIDDNNKPLLKLIDFGMASFIPPNNEKMTEFLGTREYSAPEIINYSGYREKIDEWAIGVVMYNMLTGFEPFKGKTESEVKDNIKFATINFEVIEDLELRDLNSRLLNRFVCQRISAKEALELLFKIKKTREIYYFNKNNKNKILYNINDNNLVERKTTSAVMMKEKEEDNNWKTYWKEKIQKIEEEKIVNE